MRWCWGLIAISLYLGRGWIANQFATSYSLTIGLTIQDRAYRPRLERAVAAARVTKDVTASFSFDPGLWSSSHINVSAPSREQTVAAARSLGDAIATAYDSAGETKLDVRVPARAYPDDNSTSTAVRTALAFGAPLLGLVAVGLFMVAWRQGRANGAITAPRGSALPWHSRWAAGRDLIPGPLFMALFAMSIPTAIAGLIV